MPGSLEDALDALEADHEFLLAGGVFTEDLIETWIDYKRENEIKPLAPAPAPVRVRAVLRLLARGAGPFMSTSSPRRDPAAPR